MVPGRVPNGRGSLPWRLKPDTTNIRKSRKPMIQIVGFLLLGTTLFS